MKQNIINNELPITLEKPIFIYIYDDTNNNSYIQIINGSYDIKNYIKKKIEL